MTRRLIALGALLIVLAGCDLSEEQNSQPSVEPTTNVTERIAAPSPPETTTTLAPTSTTTTAPTTTTAAAPFSNLSPDELVQLDRFLNPPPPPPPPPPTTCPNGSYVNSSGHTVCSPYAPPPGIAPSVPAGASARCADGTYSFSEHRQGTCSGHGGVAQWL